MPGKYTAVALSLSVWLTASHASAQTTRAGQITDEKAAKAAEVRPEPREKSDLIITRLEKIFVPAPPAIRLTFGDFRPGAGFALGAGYARPVRERGVWTSSAALSINRFKELETAINIPTMATDRIRVRAVAKWEDAPDLRVFGLGPDTSLRDETGYGLRSTEGGGEVLGRGPRWFGYGARASYLRIDSRDGTGVVPSAGSSSSPEWWHTAAYGAIDSRHAPGYTDSGALYRVAFDDYAGRASASSFTRTEVDLRQFVPVLHDNWIIALQAKADLTSSAEGQVIPFFMLPAIGGRDTLPGFDNDRFTDNNSLLLRGELRWTPSPVVDMAVFVGQGTVAATVRALDLRDLKRDWGFGARLHGPTSTVIRLEMAHGVEGWRYNIAQNVSF